jgi:hypothetical protein
LNYSAITSGPALAHNTQEFVMAADDAVAVVLDFAD